MKRSKLLVLIFIIVLLGGVFFFWNDILNLYSKGLNLPGIEKGVTNLIKKAEKSISLPPPLRFTEETQQSFLTQVGVIQWTNSEREKYGLPILKENARLNVAAEAKIQDMFDQQYFTHNSPSGLGVGDLAEMAGYEFIAIGENLALGNFEDDQVLVQAWMDSPGHRTNILSSQYEEIGVAVKKDIFEGKTIWLAVQHFGLPLSSCPQPDSDLKTEIDTNQAQLVLLKQKLDRLKIEIENTILKRGKDYRQKIEQYNSLVSQYNTLAAETKVLIEEYNLQVQLFNECVGFTN